MIKRLIPLLLIAVLLLAACAPAQESAAESIQLYYITNDVSSYSDSVIRYETVSKTNYAECETLAVRYFSGPVTEGIASPFPKDTALHACELRDSRLTLTLTDEIAELSGADLSFALTCVASTFLQLEGVEAVEIAAENMQLFGQDSLRLSAGNLLFEDNTSDLVENTLQIYYADKDQRYLLPHDVKTKLDSVAEQAAYAVTQLLASPDEQLMNATLPAGTEVLDLSIEDGVCDIDFSAEFYRNRPQSEKGERMTLLSIVNTLTEFEEIRSVQFFVEGEILETYYKASMNIPYERDEAANGPVRYGANETDGTLYVLRANDSEFVQIPVRIKPSANENAADALLQALIAYPAKNGLYSPVPKNTEVLSLEISGEYCYLDFSKAFAAALEGEAAERAAVQSVAHTLKSLTEVAFVSISIEGENSGLSHVNLNQIF